MATWGPSEALTFSLLTTRVGIFVGILWPPLDYTWSNSYSSIHDLKGVLRSLNFPIEAHVHSPRRGDPGHSSDFGIAPNRDQIKSLTMDGPCQYSGPELVSRSSHCICPGQSCWTPVPHCPGQSCWTPDPHRPRQSCWTPDPHCPGQSCWTPDPHGPGLCALLLPQLGLWTPCRTVSPRLILIRWWG